MAQKIERRECFEPEIHSAHQWHGKFFCTGAGQDGEKTRNPHGYDVIRCMKNDPHGYHDYTIYGPQVADTLYCPGVAESEIDILEDRGEDESPAEADAREEREEQKLYEETWASPEVLDAREAYGNRVVNMRQQADMWNAYLDGRRIEAHDVPIMFVLTKLHRLGRMPDYADNYDDVDGYMQIAREVIGVNMIEATTAKEYQEKKAARWDDENQRVLEETLLETQLAESVKLAHEGKLPSQVGGSPRAFENTFNPNEKLKPRHPYENVERDAEAEAMNAYDSRRLGLKDVPRG